MGAHPGAPSVLVNGPCRSLLSAVEADPEVMLGPDVHRRFGPRLPYLLKVLAAAQPLSFQAHPNAEQAREGFAREEAAGIGRDDRQRCYRDPFDKPELVCALESFSALCGFRPIERTRQLLDLIAVPELAAVTRPLWSAAAAEGLEAVVQGMLAVADPGPLVTAVQLACRRNASGAGRWRTVFEGIDTLAEHYPADRGVLLALLLNRVELKAGEALFLGPGQPHCYLEGMAVELMASSDNVLRGGLTSKHVDTKELLRVLALQPTEVAIVRPRPVDDIEQSYDVGAPAFALSRLTLPAGGAWAADVRGPEIVLATEGSASVDASTGESVSLPRGASAFIPAATGSYQIRSEAGASVFRATAGQGPTG